MINKYLLVVRLESSIFDSRYRRFCFFSNKCPNYTSIAIYSKDEIT